MICRLRCSSLLGDVIRSYSSSSKNFNLSPSKPSDLETLLDQTFRTFNKKFQLKNISDFKFEQIRQNLDIFFLDKFSDSLNFEVSKVQKKITSTFESISNQQKPSSEIMQMVMNPTATNFAIIANYIINTPLNKLHFLPVSTELKNEIKYEKNDIFARKKLIDYMFEKLMYMKFKPHYHQYIYTDKDNDQNFNKNLTMNIMNMDHPYEWYPAARKLKRKFIMHVGPTNSGKTYNALKRLESCSKGYFAGPLRLLAREVYDKFQNKGIRCNLVTGEEVLVDIDDEGNRAGLTSGTVEMMSLSDPYDVVVVDEIQMIGDEFRGSAWSNVILGARAKEIHLCGEASAVPLIKKLVKMTGDDIEVNEYNRLGKLVVDNESIGLDDLQKGDCLVCFSKPVILDMKRQVENTTGLRCAVIYGALPPETRAQEAQRFNDGYYDLVIASDAIGMGLNLKINRVIFTTTTKYNGKTNVTLSESQIKQIGGRAGRFGVGEGEGHVTAATAEDLTIIKRAIDAPVKHLERAVIWPPDGLWVKYYSMFAQKTLVINMFRQFERDLTNHYRSTKHLERDFELQSMDEKRQIATFFSKKNLEGHFYIADLLRCISCPTTVTSSPNRALKLITDDLFVQFMNAITDRKRLSIFEFKNVPLYLTSPDSLNTLTDTFNKPISRNGSAAVDLEPVPSELKTKLVNGLVDKELKEFKDSKMMVKKVSPVEERLQKLEQFHKAMGTFMWLSYRFPQNFIDSEAANKLRELTEYRISEMLGNLRSSNKLHTKKFTTLN
ncbi:ATP-dependent RNA helicase [Martiniozyma asiatica (nom. inval.)]|nr:ATP-dependent RNA helicase [Martiniozyma asiatica]